MFIPLYKCLIRSHFDYAVTVWDPYILKLIDDIESVQRRATALIPEIKKLSYPERLQKLGLPTLAYRRARGEMIEVFKIISNIYDYGRAAFKRMVLTFKALVCPNTRSSIDKLPHIGAHEM